MVVFSIWIFQRKRFTFPSSFQHRISDTATLSSVPVTLRNLLAITLLIAIHCQGFEAMRFPASWQLQWTSFLVLTSSSVAYALLVLAIRRMPWWKRYPIWVAGAFACLFAGLALFALVEGTPIRVAQVEILGESGSQVAILGKRQLVMFAWLTVFLGCWITVFSRIDGASSKADSNHPRRLEPKLPLTRSVTLR